MTYSSTILFVLIRVNYKYRLYIWTGFKLFIAFHCELYWCLLAAVLRLLAFSEMKSEIGLSRACPYLSCCSLPNSKDIIIPLTRVQLLARIGRRWVRWGLVENVARALGLGTLALDTGHGFFTPAKNIARNGFICEPMRH